jgi:hypothetical protein
MQNPSQKNVWGCDKNNPKHMLAISPLNRITGTELKTENVGYKTVMKKILLIEDDQQILELLDINLKDISCESVKAKSRARWIVLCAQ